MKTKKYIPYTIIALVAAIHLLPVACTDPYNEWQPRKKPEVPFTLSLELPQPKTPDLTTRAMTEDEESQVQELTLLLFTMGTGNTERLESTYHIPGSALTRNATNRRLYTTTVTLEPGSYSTFIVLANSEAILSTPAAQSLLTQGTLRSRIEEELLLSLNDGDHWDVSPSAPRRFPMWGTIAGGNTGIVINNTPGNYSAKLFRMLASIDLIIEQEDQQGQLLPAFDLTQVHLCNFYRNGRMIPDTTRNYHPDSIRLLAPSLPATAHRVTYTQPLCYAGTLADATAAPDIVIRREIFTFEQPPSDGLEESKAPFIILEGEYEGTDYPSFYRIDFVERQHEDPADPLPATDHFLPLIRNYTYTIVVREILGPGYRSLEDAATCKPFNTVSELFRFDDSDAESVQFDGKYFLSVSDEAIHYDKEQSTRTFVVKTDSPLGWQIGDISYSGGDGSEDWLHMDKDHGSRNGNGEVNLTADTYNPTVPDPTPREATFTVTSGRMEHTVHVTQSHLQGISLEIVDADGQPLTEIRFRSNPRNPDLTPIEDQKETFTVKWSGPSGCRIRTIMLGNRIFPFQTSGYDAIYEGRELGNGEEEYTFTITPTAFTLPETDPAEGQPFLQEGATVTFQVTNGEETLTQSIYIRHECISIVVENPETYSYMGHQNTLTVYSNTSWVLHEVACELPNLFLIPGTSTDFTTRQGSTGGYNTKTGDKVSYKVQAAEYDNGLDIYSLNRSGRKMSLTFRDTEGIAPNQTIEIVAATPDPNCYLVPGGQTVHIPLRKLFWVWEKEGERATPLSPSGNLNPEAVIAWQTSTGLIAQTTLTHNTGDYRDATLAVRAGNIPYGNALIAIRSGGETLWSFHIWVTDYNPNSGPVFTYPGGSTFMDRNIGSNGNYDIDNITPACVGMYYQWGRKDPFPGPKDFILDYQMHVDFTLQYPLYNAGGARVYTTYQEIASGTVKNLSNSINHPTSFYTCINEGTIMEDWYTAQTEAKYQNDYLWNDRQNRKTVFDPCPAGWRVSHYERMMDLYDEFTVASYSFVNDSYPTFTLPTGEFIVFPNGGQITDGTSMQAGKWEKASASLWDNTTSGFNAHSEAFGAQILLGTGARKAGYNVRCVKDTHKWY